MKYNLGCGKRVFDGYINYDKDELDLNRNFELKDANEILLYHVLEHIDNPLKTMYNIHRELDANGVVKVKLPSYSCDILHKNFAFNGDYFRMLGYRATGTGLQEDYLFNIKKVKYQLSFKCFLSNIKKWLLSMMSYTVYFELEKR